jgi:hypothetical protein
MMEFVSWDDNIPNIWEKHMFETTNQSTSIGNMMVGMGRYGLIRSSWWELKDRKFQPTTPPE